MLNVSNKHGSDSKIFCKTRLAKPPSAQRRNRWQARLALKTPPARWNVTFRTGKRSVDAVHIGLYLSREMWCSTSQNTLEGIGPATAPSRQRAHFGPRTRFPTVPPTQLMHEKQGDVVDFTFWQVKGPLCRPHSTSGMLAPWICGEEHLPKEVAHEMPVRWTNGVGQPEHPHFRQKGQGHTQHRAVEGQGDSRNRRWCSRNSCSS